MNWHCTCLSSIITHYWACNKSICLVSSFELWAWEQFDLCCDFSSEQLVLFKFCKYNPTGKKWNPKNTDSYCIKMNRVLQWGSVPYGQPIHQLYCGTGYTDFFFCVVHQTYQMNSSKKPTKILVSNQHRYCSIDQTGNQYLIFPWKAIGKSHYSSAHFFNWQT